MSTTIDSLNIEIQSNSTNAANKIDKLAASLEKIKTSDASGQLNKLAASLERFKSVGSYGVAIKNLNNLASALQKVKDASSGAERLTTLAASIEALKKAGSFGSISTSITKMGTALSGLDKVDIDAFVAKIKELDSKLGPVSTKLIAVGNAFKAVNSSTKAAGNSVNVFGKSVNVTALNMSSLVTVMQGVIQALRPIINLINQCVSAAMEWDGVSARFVRGFGEQAEETYEWIQRLNKEMGINVQQFMQYSSTYATMLTGFGVASKDASTMALGYMELTYDIWAGYNDIYKTFDEAATAVRSAIAGEVEPIRRAGFTIIESTLEQTAANHGLEISLESATEAQKSYLRYLTLVDQAHSQSLVGTYSKELNTAEGVMRTFTQQLKSLAQTFGSLFLPVLVETMPYLQAFVELLGEAIHALANLLGIEIQKVDWGSGLGGVTDSANDAAGALGDATEAVKEFKNATTGIDELNVISPNTSNSGSGSGTGGDSFAGLDIDSLWDESIFANIQSEVAEIKEELKGWIPLIETIGIALAGLGFAKLLTSVGSALVEMDKLNKAIAGIGIATIEAVLVFAFADDYLETGNLMSLVGEAVATGLGSYLLYKTWGNKGLVVGLAVSIAAQLVAITMNLADGGVEMDDPELWIQSAFSMLLGSVAGGWMAYKGLVKLPGGAALGVSKGIGIGFLVSASLTLAAITIGDITANGLETQNVLTGLLSTALGGAAGAGIFTALGIATGGTGFLVGAAIALAINVVGALIGSVSNNAEEELKKSLAERFGKIELDTETLEFLVNKITAIPKEITIDSNVWNEELGKYEVQTMTVNVGLALEIFSDENATLKAIEKEIQSLEKDIETKNIKITLGMDVSYDEYAATIDNYIANAQSYLDQYYLTANIALDILGANSGLSTSLESFYTTTSGQLTVLGERFKETVSAAFVDGEWIPDKLSEAMEIQKEIQEILSMISDIEYEAKIIALNLDVSGANLTKESYEEALKELQNITEERLADLEEIRLNALSVVILEYNANIEAGMTKKEAEKIRDQQIAAIEEAYRNAKVDASFGEIDWGLNTLAELYEEELENYSPVFEKLRQKALNWLAYEESDLVKGGVYTNIKEMATNLVFQYSAAAKDAMSEADRSELLEALKKLTPTAEEYAKTAEEAYAAGKSITGSLRDGLNDSAELGALANDADAILFIIGKGFTTDATFINTLSTVKGAGKNIQGSLRDGFLANIDVVRNATTGEVEKIVSAVDGKVIELTPTLRENLKSMGMDLSDGLSEGIAAKEPTLLERFKNWAGGILDSVKKKFKINSPSEETKKMGKDLSDGLELGMEPNCLRDKLSSIWTTAKNWWDKSKGTLSTYTPSIGSILDKVKSAWNSAKNWYNNSKSGLNSYTPTIGSIKDKLSTAWNSAKTWWNNSKGSMSYTPTVGSIKDKLSSAWSTAKAWWDKNVKLSIPSLSFKVTYTNSGLTGIKKAIVSALGLDGWPTLKFAANGGIFDQGSLVWAGESGAEIVANAGGGKTGVMNVQQMQDAVYEGVYAAVVAAMRASNGGGGGQSVSVYLDGRQITSSVEKTQRERGASIMGSELYAY